MIRKYSNVRPRNRNDDNNIMLSLYFYNSSGLQRFHTFVTSKSQSRQFLSRHKRVLCLTWSYTSQSRAIVCFSARAQSVVPILVYIYIYRRGRFPNFFLFFLISWHAKTVSENFRGEEKFRYLFNTFDRTLNWVK